MAVSFVRINTRMPYDHQYAFMTKSTLPHLAAVRHFGGYAPNPAPEHPAPAVRYRRQALLCVSMDSLESEPCHRVALNSNPRQV